MKSAHLSLVVLGLALLTPISAQERPARGRQFTQEFSADRKLTAKFQDGNVWIGPTGGELKQLTRNGNVAKKVQYGTACWVYGEEVGLRHAMGFNPAATKLWVYKIDTSKCLDYYVLLNQRQVQNQLDVEPYMKAGAPNPEVGISFYDVATGAETVVDVRSGQPFSDTAIGHYLYDIAWSPDGTELFFVRTDRYQQHLEFCAANPDTGKVRVIERENQTGGWVETNPDIQFFDRMPTIASAPEFKGKALWPTARNGYRNWVIVDLKSSKELPVTNHKGNVDRIVTVDLAKKRLYYMARTETNPFLVQFWMCGLDGKNAKRISDGKLNYSVSSTATGFDLTGQTVETAPTRFTVDFEGNVKEAEGSATRTNTVSRTESFKFKTFDGKYELYAILSKPSNFDPNKKYPVILDVYGGPESCGYSESYNRASGYANQGYLALQVEHRGGSQRGKAFESEVYGKLGSLEIDDMAAAMKSLFGRPYVDSTRIGVIGYSYGGYSAAMCILRYPDVFTVAVAGSAVTDWRNYDSIYTERYMGLPQTNSAGYEFGRAAQYANQLKGQLLITYGVSDNNVHQSNSLQLITALLGAGKDFEVMPGVDSGHEFNPGRKVSAFLSKHLKP